MQTSVSQLEFANSLLCRGRLTLDQLALRNPKYLWFILPGEKAIIHLVHRLPTGEEEETPRLVQDPTVASLLCAIYQLTNKNDKNSKLVLVVCFPTFLSFPVYQRASVPSIITAGLSIKDGNGIMKHLNSLPLISLYPCCCRFLRKTIGIHKMVRIATDQDKNYSPRVIKIANQVSKVPSINQSINQPINQSINQSINQLIKQSSNQWVI